MASVADGRRTKPSIEQLAVLAKSGDSIAFEDLFLSVKPFLHKKANHYSLTSGRYDADDIFGIGCEAFMKAVQDFEHEKGFKFITLLGTYFFNHYTSRYYEKEKRSRKYESLTRLDEVVGDNPNGENITALNILESEPHDHTVLYVEDIKEVYSRVLVTLSHRDKRIVELHIDKKVPQKDLAKDTSLSVKTISKIINDFRRKFKAELVKEELY